MVFQETLFERNLALLLQSNPRLVRGGDFDPEQAQRKRDESSSADEWQDWLAGNVQRLIKLPEFMPRSAEVAQRWGTDLQAASIMPGSISSYVDLHDDVHLRQAMLDLRDAIERVGADPVDDVSTVLKGIPLLLALGTGSGEVLAKMLQMADPFHLIVAVTNWDDFLSSCWFLDWSAIWQRYEQDPMRRITLVRVHSAEELFNVAAKHSLLSLEHAYLYHSASAESELKGYAEKVFKGQIIDNTIHYLGYTIDEYNMVYSSAITLKKQPKIFQAPSRPSGCRFVICGSGPSLDDNLDLIRELGSDHLIVAGGSNYRTLRKAGIDPHFLVLMERSFDTYDDYANCVRELGRSQTRLVMSSTCTAELIDLFDETAVFFRPALTPLAVFSDRPGEVLSFEGPESVNTAMALALAVGAASVACFGVDLGTRDLERGRSASAAGITNRRWDQQEAGNFSDTAYTNRAQLDVRLMLETAIRVFAEQSKVYNCSDGLRIEGAEPLQPTAYLDMVRSAEGSALASPELILQWWSSLPIYSPERLTASWRARRPRESTFRLARQLEQLFAGDTPWFPTVLEHLHQLFDLNVPLREQFPRRIMRSTISKCALAVTQQFHVMLKAPQEQQIAFGAEARQIMVDLVLRIEREIYSLCDVVEA